MARVPKLDALITPHPSLPGKDTCTACLQDLEDEVEILERDVRQKPSKKKQQQLQKLNKRINRLWWKKSSKTMERCKHFAYCWRQDLATKAACKKAIEERDTGAKSPKLGSSRSSTSAEPIRARKSSRAPVKKQTYHEESVLPEAEMDDDFSDIEEHTTASKAKGKKRAAPVVEDSEDEREDNETERKLDFTEYFASTSMRRKRKKRRASVSSGSSESGTSSDSEEDEDHEMPSRGGSVFSPAPSRSTAPTAPRTASRSVSANLDGDYGNETDLHREKAAQAEYIARQQRETQEADDEESSSE